MSTIDFRGERAGSRVTATSCPARTGFGRECDDDRCSAGPGPSPGSHGGCAQRAIHLHHRAAAFLGVVVAGNPRCGRRRQSREPASGGRSGRRLLRRAHRRRREDRAARSLPPTRSSPGCRRHSSRNLGGPPGHSLEECDREVLRPGWQDEHVERPEAVDASATCPWNVASTPQARASPSSDRRSAPSPKISSRDRARYPVQGVQQGVDAFPPLEIGDRPDRRWDPEGRRCSSPGSGRTTAPPKRGVPHPTVDQVALHGVRWRHDHAERCEPRFDAKCRQTRATTAAAVRCPVDSIWRPPAQRPARCPREVRARCAPLVRRELSPTRARTSPARRSCECTMSSPRTPATDGGAADQIALVIDRDNVSACAERLEPSSERIGPHDDVDVRSRRQDEGDILGDER